MVIVSSVVGVEPAQIANVVHQVLDRSANSSRIQRTWSEVDPRTGDWVQRKSSYTQLEDGLNYFDPDLNAWAESREVIELAPGGAVARYGQHRAFFSPNVNDPAGALDFEVNHEVRLRASLLALRYFNPVDGRSVVIATVQDAQGELLPPHQVIWRDVFDKISASLVVTVRKSGIESDVVLHEIPPAAEDFGMPSEVARLEVVTEFFDPPQPVRKSRTLATVDDPVVRGRVAEPDWIDEELDFGPNRIAAGRAFAWSQREAARAEPENFSPVGKRWVGTPDGRHFLVESVEVLGLLDELLELPGPDARLQELRDRARSWAGRAPDILRRAAFRQASTATPVLPRRADASRSENFPSRRLAQAVPNPIRRPMLLAQKAPTGGSDLVIDWVSLSAGTPGFTLRGDETYHVTAYSSFYSGLTLEGGAVLKFPVYLGSNSWPAIAVYGAFQCKTSAFRPAVFTAECDNTVGESVVSGSPDPTLKYGHAALYFQDSALSQTVEHIRVRHNQYAVYFYGNNPNSIVRNSQFLGCNYSIRQYSTNTPLRILNCLVQPSKSSSYVFYGNYGSFFGENLTLANANNLVYQGTVLLTNSILAAITNLNTGYSGANNVLSNSTAGLFAPVGSGAVYLPASSPLRNAGTTNISASLAADLRQLTTTGPSLLTAPVTTFTQLQPQAPRDTDLPDLGYHYPPIDYAVSGLVVSNALLSLTNGVVLAAYGTTGLTLQSGAQLLATGAPHQLVRLVRCDTVQESVSSWVTNGNFALIQLDAPAATGANRPSLDLRYTDLAHLAVTTNATTSRLLLAAGTNAPLASLSLAHSRIRGLHLDLGPSASGAGNTAIILFNNLFEHSGLAVSDPASGASLALTAHHNLHSSGPLTLATSDTNTWTLRDNLFASATLAVSGISNSAASHNGFRAGLAAFGDPSNNRTNLALDFVSGPLGRHYYPTNGAATSLTNLVNTGSRSAPDAGLYHHTVRVDQTKEATSTVDIGFHYVALDATGTPVDTDGDGWPDYFEDTNGNGIHDGGETDWADSDSDLSAAPASLLLFTPLR